MVAKLPERLMLRNGTFYCRIWVPSDIAPIYGRQVVVTSLRTKDLKTAKTKLARRTVEAEDEFESLRMLSAAAPAERPFSVSSLPLRQRFATIARQHAIEVCDREFEWRARFHADVIADPSRLWRGELFTLPTAAGFGRDGDAYTYFDQLVAEGDLEAVVAYLIRFRLRQRLDALKRMRAIGDLREFLTVANARLADAQGIDAVALARLLLDDELDALKAIEAHKSDPSLQEMRAAIGTGNVLVGAESPREVVAPRQSSISLQALFERWEDETEPSASTLSSWRGIVRHLQSFLGAKAKDISSISPDDIVAWKDQLVREEKSAATIAKGYLACARTLFRFAVSNRLLDGDPSENVRLARKMTKPGKKMLGYTSAEVARLLNLASAADEPWKRWLPWLAAATGSRIGEMAQLHGSHFFEEDGFAVVRITPAPDAGSVKTAESERTVPLHKALLEAGILDFVAAKGDGPLFYSRSSGDPKRKHASKGVSNRLATWIRKNGFNDLRKAPNHALRHWFKTEASKVGIPDSVADALQGHSDGRPSALYRHVGLEVMAAALDKIELPPRC